MSPGGHAPKGRGTSYEYRVRNWFQERGWEAERNPLSGASDQISETTGKHDVRAKKAGLFLQIECKKTGAEDKHKLQRIWFEKIDFKNDEFLVFAFSRSDHYAIITQGIYKALNPDFLEDTPRYTAEGASQFTFHRAWLNAEDPVCFLWKDYGEIYVATELSKFIALLEKRGPLETLNPIDVIKATDDIPKLLEWYKIHKHRLTNKEKHFYYNKLCMLEEGCTGPSREFIASQQFWRDTSDDIVMKCPHCTNLITYKQLKESQNEGGAQ
jgi:hypothetical protein